jgi:hypothetical protein
MCDGWDATALVLVPRSKHDVGSMAAFNLALRNQQTTHKKKVGCFAV